MSILPPRPRLPIPKHEKKTVLPTPIAIILILGIATIFLFGIIQSGEHKKRVPPRPPQLTMQGPSPLPDRSLHAAKGVVQQYFAAYRHAIRGRSLSRETRVRVGKVASPFAVSQLVDLSHQPGDPAQRSAVTLSQIGVRTIEGNPVGYAIISTQWGSSRVWLAIHTVAGKWQVQRIEKTVAIEDTTQEGNL